MLRVFVVLVFSLFAAVPALAQFTGPSRTVSEVTANQVSGVRVGSRVTLVGHIVDRIWDDYYTFRDDTGEIRVEIDPIVFRRQPVTADTLVQITGEVERNLFFRYIDVERLVVLD